VPADDQPSPSDEELAGLLAVLASRVDVLETENAGLRAENAELRRRLGMNSGNSSVPPSREPIAARAGRKAKRAADRSWRERSADRKPGGQAGHQGSGLTAAVPDRTKSAVGPAGCRGCGADLTGLATGASDAGTGWAQVRDILPVVLEKVHWWLPRRRCGCCGKVTTAAAPHAQAGSVVYGPNINAAAILLSSEGNVPVERAAALMEALLGVPVSAGFVARALARLAERLQAAGFDAAMKDALRAEDVLCGDETPANVIRKNTGPDGEPEGAPHAVVIRTPDARLIWYAAMRSRSGASIAGLGVLDGWHGYLVRDDYAAWNQFDAQLAGTQQCCAHLIRYCTAVLELHPQWQAWAGKVRGTLREAAAAVQAPAATAWTSSTPCCSPACAPGTTRKSPGASPPAGTATGTKATTPAITSPPACKPKPPRSGYSRPTSKSRGPITPPSRPSRARSGIRPSPGTGTPMKPSRTTAGPGPISSAHAGTASAPPTPFTPPSPANPGYLSLSVADVTREHP
jgi:transposase